MVFLSGITGGFNHSQGFVLIKMRLLAFSYIVWICVFSRTAGSEFLMGMGYVIRCCSNIVSSSKIFLLFCHLSKFSICVSVGIVLLIHACSVDFTVPKDLHMQI